jgi:hypothetical protein
MERRPRGPAQRRKSRLRTARLLARSPAVTVIRCRPLWSREARIATMNVFLVVLRLRRPSRKTRA